MLSRDCIGVVRISYPISSLTDALMYAGPRGNLQFFILENTKRSFPEAIGIHVVVWDSYLMVLGGSNMVDYLLLVKKVQNVLLFVTLPNADRFSYIQSDSTARS